MNFNLMNDIKPKLNSFDLSHNHYMTLDFGKLYPIAWMECVPGDIFDLSVQALVRVQPMDAPIMNNITCDLHAFFVPTRLLWDDWESFITTVDQNSIPPKTFEGTPPVWGDYDDDDVINGITEIDTSSGSLWDCLGFSRIFKKDAMRGLRPTDFLRRAYYFIWNEWFRDENLQEPIDFKKTGKQELLYRAWRKDYFTAAYYGRQKGTSPAINLSGSTKVLFNGELPNYLGFTYSPANGQAGNNNNYTVVYHADGNEAKGKLYLANNASVTQEVSQPISSKYKDAFVQYLQDNSVDFANVGTFDTNDLRDMVQIQKFFERLMMAGSRYIEFLQSQFGVSPSDARLQIPERIGGTSFNINISEVIQNSATTSTSPQGTQTGHGLSVSAGHIGNYKAVEFGYIMILGNIQPPSVYVDRMPKSVYRKTLLEQFNPHFVNLSFQAINNREIYASGEMIDNEIFAFAGRYDELREQQSYVSGDFYDLLDFYLNFRKFDEKPSYNSEFIECKPNNNIFSVKDEPPFLCNFYIDCRALRPIPVVSEPGLVDHVFG